MGGRRKLRARKRETAARANHVDDRKVNAKQTIGVGAVAA